MRDSRCGGLSSYILLMCGLSICMGLLLHNLDHDYIAPWDEVVHITVVHNLYSDCCDPKLHRIDLGRTEQSDWTNNSFGYISRRFRFTYAQRFTVSLEKVYSCFDCRQ